MLEKIFNFLTDKKEYDLYIPFGRSCHCTMMLKNHNLRVSSFPFDWIIPATPSNLINERFELLFNIEKLFHFEDFIFDRNAISASKHYKALNTKYNFCLTHDFDMEKSDEENFALVKEKYIRRNNRLIEYFSQAKKVCFVFVSNTWDQMWGSPKINYKELNSLMKNFQKKFPDKKFDFVVFQHKSKMRKNRISQRHIYPYVHVYRSNHSYKMSEETTAPIITIEKVLSKYTVSNKINQMDLEYNDN